MSQQYWSPVSHYIIINLIFQVICWPLVLPPQHINPSGVMPIKYLALLKLLWLDFVWTEAVKLVGLSIKSSKQSILAVMLQPNYFWNTMLLKLEALVIQVIYSTKSFLTYRTSKNVLATVVLEIWNLSVKSITGIFRGNCIVF